MEKIKLDTKQIKKISNKANELNRELQTLDEDETARLLDFIRGYALACERQKQFDKKQNA